MPPKPFFKINSDLLLFTLFLVLSFSALLLAGGIVWAAEALPVPTITINPDIYYPFDEVIYIEGRSAPKETVQVRFFKQGAEPVLFTTKSDANGEWVLAQKVSLEEGDWEIRARILLDSGAASQYSNPRIFKAVITGITIGGVNIKFAALSLIIVILLIFGGGLFWYFNLRVKQLKAALLSKEIGEAQESVREGLAELRQNILDELRILESSGGRLTAGELARKEHLLRELDRIERNAEREIQDIRKGV